MKYIYFASLSMTWTGADDLKPPTAAYFVVINNNVILTKERIPIASGEANEEGSPLHGNQRKNIQYPTRPDFRGMMK